MITVARIAPALALACAAGAALAQPATAPREPPPDTLFFVANAAPALPFGAPFQVVGFAGDVPGTVVAGKPYAADSITESTQTLQDGNRITGRNEARFARDSKGRTRREQTMRGFGPAAGTREPVTLVTINDPVADVSYFLDTAARTAQPSRPFKVATGVAGTFNAATPPPLPPPAGVASSAIGTLSLQAGPAPSFASTTEDLGQQVLEGMLARGTRRTQTIPAGAMGNERPIQIVAEQWYSSDIDAVVQSRNYDPRVGETTYRLVNVVRGEQPPDLFSVPEGYALLPERRVEFGAFGAGGPGMRVERGTTTAPGRN